MAVYAVFEVELLTDPSPHEADGYERYRAAVPELIARRPEGAERSGGSSTRDRAFCNGQFG
ncbi:MAG: hypothetical protein WKF45_08220 [Ilumatobacteraceae bacterium]